METKLIITGMDCEHCAAHVKEALEEIEGVEKVKIELKKGIARVKHKDKIDSEIMCGAVQAAGYRAAIQ